MSLTKILHEAYLRSVCESESLSDEDDAHKKNAIEDEFDVIDAKINGKEIDKNLNLQKLMTT